MEIMYFWMCFFLKLWIKLWALILDQIDLFWAIHLFDRNCRREFSWKGEACQWIYQMFVYAFAIWREFLLCILLRSQIESAIHQMRCCLIRFHVKGILVINTESLLHVRLVVSRHLHISNNLFTCVWFLKAYWTGYHLRGIVHTIYTIVM